MSRPDVAEMIAELTAQRSKIDAAIAALRPLANGNGASPDKAPARWKKLAPAKWTEAREWWDDGMRTEEIARKLGISNESVYQHARSHKWPKRAARGKRITLERAMRCQFCQQLTQTDPCACGARVSAVSPGGPGR